MILINRLKYYVFQLGDPDPNPVSTADAVSIAAQKMAPSAAASMTPSTGMTFPGSVTPGSVTPGSVPMMNSLQQQQALMAQYMVCDAV